jgi:hypothetical protein
VGRQSGSRRAAGSDGGWRRWLGRNSRVPELQFSPNVSSVPIADEGLRATIGTSSGGFLQVLDP